MKYIVCKTFNKKGIDKDFNLRKGSSCEEENGFIKHNDEVICAKSSQNAYDFFSRNDDGNGYERFSLVGQIIAKIQEIVIEYNEAVAEVTANFTEETTEEEMSEALSAVTDTVSEAYNKIKNLHPTFLHEHVFTFEFYNAEISELEGILEIL